MQDFSISQAELQVLRVIWAQQPVTSQQIIQALATHFDWQTATIKTLLTRLKNKGVIVMEKVGTKYYYQALLDEKAYQTKAWQHLLDSMCNTKQGDLLMDLLISADLSKSQLENISQKAQTLAEIAPKSLVCHCIPGQCTCGRHH